MSDAALETPERYTTRRVEELRTIPIDMFGQPVPFLDTQDSERFAGHLVAYLLSEGVIDRGAAVAAAKDGDPLFQHALGLLGVAERPKKLQTGPVRETNFFRDIAITMLVQELLVRFAPIKATTSSKDGHSHCACGVVARAMGMTYDAVCKVWSRLNKQI